MGNNLEGNTNRIEKIEVTETKTSAEQTVPKYNEIAEQMRVTEVKENVQQQEFYERTETENTNRVFEQMRMSMENTQKKQQEIKSGEKTDIGKQMKNLEKRKENNTEGTNDSGSEETEAEDVTGETNNETSEDTDEDDDRLEAEHLQRIAEGKRTIREEADYDTVIIENMNLAQKEEISLSECTEGKQKLESTSADCAERLEKIENQMAQNSENQEQYQRLVNEKLAAEAYMDMLREQQEQIQLRENAAKQEIQQQAELKQEEMRQKAEEIKKQSLDENKELAYGSMNEESMKEMAESNDKILTEMQNDKTLIDTAVQLKYQEIYDYVTSNNMDRYETSVDPEYRRMMEAYRQLRETQKKVHDSMRSVEFNNQAMMRESGGNIVGLSMDDIPQEEIRVKAEIPVRTEEKPVLETICSAEEFINRVEQGELMDENQWGSCTGNLENVGESLDNSIEKKYNDLSKYVNAGNMTREESYHDAGFRKMQAEYADLMKQKQDLQTLQRRLDNLRAEQTRVKEQTEKQKVDEVEIKKEAFQALPENRVEAVKETFSEAPQEVKKVINELSDKLEVEATRDYKDKNGQMIKETEHYDLEEKKIRMGEHLDNDEYAEVFRHEYGHFVDANLGNVSASAEFISSIDSDTEQYKDAQYKEEMLKDLEARPEAMEERCVSDILSGVFQKDPQILKRYEDKRVAFYGHEDWYWNNVKYARERETFANLFSVYSAGDRKEAVTFLEKYFPNTTESFKKIMSDKSRMESQNIKV